ncbi:tachykinin-4 [Talpa occidentalis]|uniref:tachykinin-4 n=1 Tax=Talpa occidentalis TaxID=50954 RepID=UPI00188F4497|nr:tachykinin-4 [Talpa occidentalis]
MLLGLALLLLMGLNACTWAGDEELVLSAEVGPWVTVTLEEDIIPSIQFQLQEVKRGKASQFFGLMGKRVGGIPPLQSERRTGYHRGQMVQDLLGRKGPSTEELSPGREDEDVGSK